LGVLSMRINSNIKVSQNIVALAIWSIFISIIMSAYWNIPFLCVLIPMLISTVTAAIAMSNYANHTYASLSFFLYVSMTAIMCLEVKNSFIPLMGIDWKGYSARAVLNLESGRWGLGLLFTNTGDLFAKIISVLYQIFGIYPEMIHCYIFALSFGLLSGVSKLAKMVFENSVWSERCMFLLNFTPVFAIHSIAFLREIPIAFFFVVSLVRFYKYIKYGGVFDFVLAVLFGAVSAIFHSGMVVVPIAYIVSLLFYRVRSDMAMFDITKVIVVVVLFFALFASPMGKLMLTKFSGNDVLTTIDLHITTDATTSYISDAPESATSLILQTPYRFVLFELVPLPWHIRSVGTGISWLLDGTVRLYIFYNVIRLIFCLKRANLSTKQKVLFSVCIFIWLGFGILCGWGTTTYGTAIRHRVKILPMEILMVTQMRKIKNESSLCQRYYK